MGSTIPSAATIAFSIDFYDPDGEAITLELFDRSILVATTSVSGVISNAWTVTVPGAAGHFYFARATQADGDRAYTSPLWTEGTAAPDIIALNEVLPEPQYEDWNGDGLADSDDEWIELYNPGERAVGLGGWQLDDVGDGGSSHYVIPFGTVIQPKDFLVFFKRETGIALNNDGDWVRLLYPDGSEADVFHYTSSPGDDRSWSRVVDGIGGWTKFFDVTPGKPNRPPPPGPTPTPFPLFTIAEARRQPSRTTVTVRGQVTVPPPLFGEKTLCIQDSTGGIMIYTSKSDYLPLAEGDWVVLRGEAYDYHGEREIRIYRDSDLLLHQGTGEPLKPTVIKTGQVDEDHEGLLAMLAGRVVGYEWQAIHLDDGTGPVRVYIKRGTDIEKPWVEEGQIFSVIGIVSQYAREKPYEGGYRLLPRYQSDLLQLPLYLPETGTLR
jgi:DNA/RNA endonuclease YhcR with UshA esterase domain